MPFYEQQRTTSAASASTSSSAANIGAAIGRRTRPFVSALQDTAKSYGSRQTRFGEQRLTSLEEDTDVKGKRPNKILTHIRKSLSISKRPTVPHTTPNERPRRSLTEQNNNRVLYSTPAERSRDRTPNAPLGLPSHISPAAPPTIAQIAMGLHNSRTPHQRAIRPQHPQSPTLGRRQSHGTRSTPDLLPSRPALKSSATAPSAGYLRVMSTTSSISSNTTLSTPNSSFNALRVQGERFFGRGKKTRGAIKNPSSLAGSSTSSRKTVRFDDSASA